MKKQLYVLVALLVAATMVLTACGTATVAPTAAAATAAPAATGPVLIRWSIGVGTGADPAQVTDRERRGR